MLHSAPTGRRPVYYGWWIVAAATALLTVGAGLGQLSFTFYITPMEKTFGWSRTETSVAAVINMVMFSLAAPLAGLWVDRRGVRSALLAGTIVTALGFVALRFTSSLGQFYLFWGIVAFSRTWMTFMPAGILVSRWFRRRRGLALTVVSSGPALGAVIVIPVLARLIDRFGWEGAYLATAIVLPVLFIPITLLVIRDRPSDLGLYPDGDSEAPREGVGVRHLEQEFTFREALRSKPYWITNVAYLFFWTGSDSFMPHQAPFFESRGLDQNDVARILQLASLVALSVRFLMLFYIDRIHELRLLAAFTSACFALAMTAVIFSTGVSGLAAFILLWGVGQAAGPSVRPLMLSRYFGTMALGALMGLTEMMNVGGMFIGPVLGGVIFDRTGSYTPALAFYAAAIGVSVIFFLFSFPPGRRAPKPAAAGTAAAAPLS